MTTSITPSLPVEQQQVEQAPPCMLKWRLGQLLVSRQHHLPLVYLPPLENQKLLVECLTHSSVKLIQLDLDLGESSLKLWADACEQANKAVFLRLPNNHELRQRRTALRVLIERITAAILLLVTSPLMLGLMSIISLQSSEPIFLGEWRVGERGKVFRLFKFKTGSWGWMGKYHLDKLPQLLNVLRGEMSLVGARPWTLFDAVRLSPKQP